MISRTLVFVLAIAALACPGPCLNGQELPSDSPEQAGFSREALARIAAQMQKHIDANRITGATGLIARHGKVVYFETYGAMDRESAKAMRKDAIFRIYSMTKAVTGVAVMILHDEGKFALSDPVARYLPEFANSKVAVEENDSQTGKRSVRLVEAERPISILDLLRHTSGINYQGPRDQDGASYYRALGYRDPDANLETMVKKLAQAPLVHQPGTTWEYGYSIDVLGRLVEVVSGMPLDRFFETRIFQPLGMGDTGFVVPESKWDRLVTLDTPGADQTVRRSEGPAQNQYKKPATWFSGGGGLVSTTSDYARFCQMLLNNGELDGVRVLSKAAVQAMRTDCLGDLPHSGSLLAKDTGFGLTFAISKTTGDQGTKGIYNWGGAAGTRFWIDPEKDLFGIYMINILPHTGLHYGDEFRRLVYEAFTE
jgi:CubicO group peptidase (beta-lactamase class C family)